MPLMQYKAMDERGKTTFGRMDAVNDADLELRLNRMGLDLINYKPAKLRGIYFTKRVPRRELIGFCFHLEQLLGSGVALLDGLLDLRDSIEDARMREVVAGIIESIEGGKTLSEALAEFPHVFDQVFINLVNAGEMTGRVDEVLRRITESLKWQDEQAALTKKLMFYPILVAIAVLIALLFLMVVLVPQLVVFIKSMGHELPTHTRILIATSEFLVKYWYLAIAVPGLLAMGAMLVKQKSPAVQYAIDDFKLRTWVVGPLLRKIILARFANYFALMYAAGISVLECIRITEGIVGNKAIQMATHRAGQQIADGASISAGFEQSSLFPPLVLRMLRVGENTGKLDTALLNISYFYDRDVHESMLRLQTMIGPVMTVVLGGILFWVIIAVIGPIYDIITTIDI